MTIYCKYDALVPTSQLDSKRHPKNPKGHGAAQVAAIAAVFEGNGIRQCIVISNRSGLITKGHGRLDAALMLGYEEFPVQYQDYETEQAELSDMVADNRLAELGDVDDSKLLELLKELERAGHDIELAGFTADDLEKLCTVEEIVEQTAPVPKMELQAFEHYDYLMFMFKDIRDWLRVIQLMKVARVDYTISRKSPKIGIGRVLNGKNLLRRLEDSARDNVTGSEQPSANAPGSSENDARRS